MIRDSSFTCNTRFLHDAYPAASRWMLAYDFPMRGVAVHAFDLVPLYMNSVSDAVALIESFDKSLIPTGGVTALAKSIATAVMPTYQAYLGAFAARGGPNSIADAAVTSAPSWATAAPGPTLGSVMDVSGAGWQLGQDGVNTQQTCSFWQGIAQAVLAAVGPAGAASNGRERTYWHLLQEVGKQDTPGDVWLITANPFDVVGASAAGLKTAWIDRAGKGWVDRLGDVIGVFWVV